MTEQDLRGRPGGSPARRPRTGLSRAAAVLAAALLVLGTAHAARTPASPSLPETGVLTAVTGNADLRLPLQRYRLPAEPAREIEKARRQAIAACAARFGVLYTDSTPTEADEAQVQSRRYGILNLRQASADGYHLPSSRTTSASQSDEWSPSEKEYRVVTGRTPDGTAVPASASPFDSRGTPLPAGGCEREAQQRLGEGLGAAARFLDHLEERSYRAAERDPRVQDAWSAWARCMSSKGYSYRSPWEPNDHYTGENQISAEERRTAEDDVRCRQSTGLSSLWLAVEVGYQQQLVTQNRAALQQLTARHDAIAGQAHRILQAADHR